MSTENPGVRLGDLLTSAGLLKIDALREAMLTAKQQNMPVGRILITSGYLTENQLQAAVQAQSLLKDGLVEMAIVVKALGILVHEQTSLEQAMARCGWHKENGAVTNKLGELLLEAQIISNGDLEHALSQCENIGLPLGRMLVLTSSLSEQMLSNALNAQVLLRDHKITREQAIKGLQSAKERQLPLESTLTESDDLQLPSSTNVRLGEFLIDAGLIDQANLMNAVEMGLVQGKLIGLVLRQLNLLAEKDLNAALELQKMIAAGTLRRREATEMLMQIHSGKASLQDILKRKQDPFALDDEPGKDELFLDQFLKIAGIITQNEIDKAIKVGTQNSDLFGKMLLSAGIMEEQMVEASLDAYALVSDDTLTMDQAMIALKNCQVRGHSLESAFKDLGWSADTEVEEDVNDNLSTSAPLATAQAEDFAPIAIPIEPVKEPLKPMSSQSSTTTLTNAPLSDSPRTTSTSERSTSSASSSQATTMRNPKAADPFAKPAAEPGANPIANPVANPVALPIAPTSKTSVPPRATTTQTLPNNMPIPMVLPVTSTPSPEAIRPTTQPAATSSDQQTPGSEFPTITPVVSKRANSNTGEFQKFVSTSAPSSTDLAPKPSYNLPPQATPIPAQQTPPVSTTFASTAPSPAASELPARTESVAPVRYGTSKEFAPQPDRAAVVQTSSIFNATEQTSIEPEPQPQLVTVVPAPAQPFAAAPPAFSPAESVAQSFVAQPFVAQPFVAQPFVAQASVAQASAEPVAVAVPASFPQQEVRPPATNAISALNASWGFGSPQGPTSNPWDALAEQPENNPPHPSEVDFSNQNQSPQTPVQAIIAAAPIAAPIAAPSAAPIQTPAPLTQNIGPQAESFAMSMGYDLSSPNSPVTESQAPPLKSLSSTSFYNTPPLTARDLEQMQAYAPAPSTQGNQTTAASVASVAPTSAATPQPPPGQSTNSFYELPTVQAPPQPAYVEQPTHANNINKNNSQTSFPHPATQLTYPAPQPTYPVPTTAPVIAPAPIPAPVAAPAPAPAPVAAPVPAPVEQFKPVEAPNPSRTHVPFTPSNSESSEGGWGAPAKSPPPNPWAASQVASKSTSEPEPDKPAPQPAAKQQKPVEAAAEVRPPTTQPNLSVPATVGGLSTPAGENPGWGTQSNKSADKLSSFADNPGWKPARPEPAPPKPAPSPAPAPQVQQPPFQQQPQTAAPMRQQQIAPPMQQQQIAPPMQQQQIAPPMQQQQIAPPMQQQQAFQMQPQQGMQQPPQPIQQQFPQQLQQPQHQQQFPGPDMFMQQTQPVQQQQQQYAQQPQQQPQAFQQPPIAAPEQQQAEGWEFSATEASNKPVAGKPKGLNALMPKGKKDKQSS